MAWLDDHPPRTQQFRCPRRQRPSGIIGVHTAESFPDETGPDTGAENVAEFIRTRSNYGSYHLLADSDSIIHLVRFECVAYHIGTHGLNEHTIGISAATQAAKWNSLDDNYADAMVRNMARAAARAARWLKQNYGITVPARRITLAQALRGEHGFLAHGDADPARRTDPGATFPWDDFLGYYADEMNGDSMSWNEDLTPGTPGNDITNLADKTLPDSYGRYAADLLGYAAAGGSVLLRPKELLDRIGKTDGVLRAPSTRPNNDTNQYLYLETFLREIWDMCHALRTVPDELEALRTGILGGSADEIKALIESKHAEAEQQRQVIADTMGAKLDAVVEATQGSDPAEAKLAAILEILGVDA